MFSGIQNLQDFDLATDFGLFDWFQHFDDELTVVAGADARVHLGVLAFADFGDHFVAFDVAGLREESTRFRISSFSSRSRIRPWLY